MSNNNPRYTTLDLLVNVYDLHPDIKNVHHFENAVRQEYKAMYPYGGGNGAVVTAISLFKDFFGRESGTVKQVQTAIRKAVNSIMPGTL